MFPFLSWTHRVSVVGHFSLSEDPEPQESVYTKQLPTLSPQRDAIQQSESPPLHARNSDELSLEHDSIPELHVDRLLAGAQTTRIPATQQGAPSGSGLGFVRVSRRFFSALRCQNGLISDFSLCKGNGIFGKSPDPHVWSFSLAHVMDILMPLLVFLSSPHNAS